MKRMISHHLFLTGLLVCIGSSAALALSLEVVPASQTVAVGTPAAVDLVISGLGNATPPSLSTFDLNVLFDASLLSLNTTDANGDGVMDSVVLDPTGQLDVLGLGGNPVAAGLAGPGMLDLFELSLDLPGDLDARQAGNFSLATITFETLAPGTSALILGINTLGDAEGNVLTATITNGTLTVTAPSAVPEPETWLLVVTGYVGLLGTGWYQRRHTV